MPGKMLQTDECFIKSLFPFGFLINSHKLLIKTAVLLMNIIELIQKRRSIRKFRQEMIPFSKLTHIVDSGRLAPTARNLQPLEFVVVDQPDLVKSIFELTSWAGYLEKDQGRPGSGEEPVAFIIVLVRRDCQSQWTGHDSGAAVENMILSALESGIGSCWLGSIQRKQTAKVLALPDSFAIDSALALGYPAETPVTVPMTDSVKYFKDKDGILNVPKRSLQDVMHHNHF